MRKARLMITGALAGVASAAAVAAASPAAGAATVELRETNRGQILVDSEGFTLYEFTHDKKRMNSCIMIMECPTFWPALTVTGAPTAGPGLKAKKLKTFMLPNGQMQVMYNMHALYTYSGDTMPGETSYIGEFAFGGNWWGMNAKGRPVT